MSELPLHYERTVIIRARPATVFRYLTDSGRFASWWGEGSTIDARVGGTVNIVFPGGATAGGEVVAIDPGKRIVFTYGYDDPARPVARGASRVTVTVASHADGTSLHLLHEVADETARSQHIAGWRFQLSTFANIAAREEHAAVAERIDAFLAAWSESDDAKRADALALVTTADIGFRDAYATLSGRSELIDHIAALQRNMPGVVLRRDGDARQCQGTVLVNWTAGPASGTNVFRLAADGRIADVVGFWK